MKLNGWFFDDLVLDVEKQVLSLSILLLLLLATWFKNLCLILKANIVTSNNNT